MKSVFEHDGSCACIWNSARCFHDLRFSHVNLVVLENSLHGAGSTGIGRSLDDIGYVDQLDLSFGGRDEKLIRCACEVGILEFRQGWRNHIFSLNTGQYYAESDNDFEHFIELL